MPETAPSHRPVATPGRITAAAIGATAILLLPLALWRLAYHVTDAAALALLLLAAVLFLGSLRIALPVHRAQMSVAIRRDTWLAHLASGRLRAIAFATLFVVLGIPVFAWHAWSASRLELGLLACLVVCAAALALAAEARLSPLLTPPFARSVAAALATVAPALVLVPVMTWANWSYLDHPAAMKTASLVEAMRIGLQVLPPRAGLPAEFLSPFAVADGAKLWLVVQETAPRWLSFWFSLDSALVGLLAARAAALLAFLVPVSGQGFSHADTL